MRASGILGVAIVALGVSGGAYAVTYEPVPAAQTAPTVKCADFPYQEDAQDALAVNPGLDGDNDGVACEALLRRPVADKPVPPSHGDNNEVNGEFDKSAPPK